MMPPPSTVRGTLPVKTIWVDDSEGRFVFSSGPTKACQRYLAGHCLRGVLALKKQGSSDVSL